MHTTNTSLRRKQALAGLLLPVSIAMSLGVFVLARELGANPATVILIVSVGTLLVAMAAERLMPHVRSWNRADGDVGTDLSSALVLGGLIDPALKYLAPVAAIALYACFDISGVYEALFGQMSFLWQVLVVTLFIELGRYWVHRAHHRIPSLWWLHAMHHSSRRLYALNTLRFHPLNYILNFAGGTFPFILIGTPAEVLLAYLALTQPVLILQHSNLGSRHGLLNYVFSTNEAHRWHHSADAAVASCNYGSALLIWDHVFCTFRYSADGKSPETVGLFAKDGHSYPSRAPYLSQIWSFFSREC